MEKLSLYEFQDYKKYLHQWMERAPNQGRGFRKQLADAIGCQTPFITHVLNGNYHLSLEQAEACARWLGLNDDETEFFILLVIKGRAGTKGLENTISKQLSQRRASETILKKRLNIKEQMSSQTQMIYYSNWYYAAIHIACLIPQLQTIEALEKYFNLSVPQIVSALEFLTEHGFIEERKLRYRVLKPVLHLEKDSPLLIQHHTQWRLKAVEAIQRKQNTDLFYSGVMSLSKEDHEWLRERLTQLLEETIHRLKNSKDETLACLNIDWFEL
ncbi:MAG: TIGR02147 family protein [Pseudobdellovibrionaceae bacterium]